MKKLLVVLLSLGLIAAFAATASAATVSFTGEYYVWGVYHNNTDVGEKNLSPALSYFFTQTRLQSRFGIADGLTFTTRVDALEKAWGNTNWRGGTSDLPNSRGAVASSSSGSEPKLQENIEFELAYVDFKTAIGAFQVGYRTGYGSFGTSYLNYGQGGPGIQMTNTMGPFTLALNYMKWFDTSASYLNSTTYAAQLGKADADNDIYDLIGVYKGKGMEAGLKYRYYVLNSGRPTGAAANFSVVYPYAKATFGPLYVEAEGGYQFGKKQVADNPAGGGAATTEQKFEAWAAYVSATYTMGPAKVGGLFAYASGNDYKDANKFQNNTVSGGLSSSSWNPAMILMNNDVDGMETAGRSHASTGVGTNAVTKNKQNIIWYGLFGSYTVTPKIELSTAFNYVTVADKKLSATTEAVDNKLGMELDAYATYKIYDNLSYMVGAGYLWTGDFFKGTNAAAKIDDDYMLMNKLTLSF